MAKIKVLHTADIHIGIENYGYINPNTGLNSRMEDFLRSFDIIVDHAINNDFDLVIFAGDAFKVQSPSSTQQREFAKRVYRLSKAKIPTILLAGNHDLSNKYGEATAMDVYGTLKIDNVYVIERPWYNILHTKNGAVQVLAIPYISRSAMLTSEDYKLKSAEDIELELRRKINQVIDNYIVDADKELPFIFTFHTGLDNATTGAEKNLMVGKTLSISTAVVARKEFDYVALGHIHKHQILSREPWVVYSGSIERVDFGEENEDKGFMVIDLEKGNTTCEFVKLPARRFITIDVNVLESEDPNKDIIEAINNRQINGAIVRVRYTISVNKANIVDDKLIRDNLDGSFFYMIRPNVIDNAPRMRNPDLNEAISADPIQSLTMFLNLQEHLEEVKDDLIDRAKKIVDVV